MTESDDDDDATESVRKRRLHGARCCTTTPPRVRWDEVLEAVVCDSCERVYAPIVSAMDDITRAAMIRAISIAKDCNTGIGRVLQLNRHAVRRRRELMGLQGLIDYVVPYADPGPKAEDLTG